MKRNFMKKAVAVSLSAAMAFSLSAATALTASAATTVSMPKTAKVTVGKNKTLKVTTNKKWKVTKVGVKQSKKYVTVKRISNTKVRVTGKKATSKAVTVRVRVKKKTGNKAEKVLKCKVTVKKASTPDVTPTPTPTPDVTPTPTPEVQTSADVANQAELDAALNNSNIKTINIKTPDKVDFVIPEGTHDVDLTVNAAAASVTNSAKFKSITIEAIAPDTWTEKGKNNTITVKGASVHFVFDPAAIIDRILVAIKSAVTIDGKASNTVPVEVAAAAEGSSVASQAPVAIKASAEVTITLEASATGSTVEVVRGQKQFDINLTNKTNNDITVKDDKGTTVVTAKKNTNTPVKGTTQVADTTTPTPTPTPTPGTSTSTKKDLTDAYLGLSSARPDVTATNGTVSGSSITNPTITLKFNPAKVYKADTTTGSSVKPSELSGVSIGYSVTINKDANIVNNSIQGGNVVGTKAVDANSKVDFSLNIDTSKVTTYILEVKAFVKENDTYKQGNTVTVGTITVTVGTDGTITKGNLEKLVDNWKEIGDSTTAIKL